MTVTRQELIAIRKHLVKEMHSYIIDMGDESIYDTWIMVGVPDCPCEDDFQWFAENDDEWVDLCKLFGKLTEGK